MRARDAAGAGAKARAGARARTLKSDSRDKLYPLIMKALSEFLWGGGRLILEGRD